MRSIVPSIVFLVAACGPSEEEKQACTTARLAAATAWGSVANLMRTEAAGARTRHERALPFLRLAEDMGTIEDPTLRAELQTKVQSGRAQLEALTRFATAADAAAVAAATIQTAYQSQTTHGALVVKNAQTAAFGAVEVEARLQDDGDRAAGASPTQPSLGLQLSQGLLTAGDAGRGALDACKVVEDAD